MLLATLYLASSPARKPRRKGKSISRATSFWSSRFIRTAFSRSWIRYPAACLKFGADLPTFIWFPEEPRSTTLFSRSPTRLDTRSAVRLGADYGLTKEGALFPEGALLPGCGRDGCFHLVVVVKTAAAAKGLEPAFDLTPSKKPISYPTDLTGLQSRASTCRCPHAAPCFGAPGNSAVRSLPPYPMDQIQMTLSVFFRRSIKSCPHPANMADCRPGRRNRGYGHKTSTLYI